nr:hypothetical protein [Neobacillus sp. Marseille-Q6967]
MIRILTGLAVGFSFTVANFVLNKNKGYSEYIAKESTGKQQKWIHIK